MKLIITEKENAARRIAEILSDGAATVDRRNGVNVYRWGSTRCVGLSGHVVGVDFPEEYSDWRDVEPVELIDADIIKSPTRENIVRTLRGLARDADEAVVATDYDREGELIGKEAYELVREETDAPVSRVRFSSITDREVRDAFANPDDLDLDLAAAGEARQTIDLVWGAALTRFLSLSARQLGDDFISVGRVQSPTLKLIVDREREIRAFEPDDYWELFADLAADGRSFEAQYFYDDDGSEAERVWDEAAAEDAHERLQDASTAEVTTVRRRTRTDNPPAPFNTTAFISAAGSLGYSAQRAMSIAEELYTTGYITYPRTDNTVYPEDPEPAALLGEFVPTREFGGDAESLLALDDLSPTEGDDETTDHPPIHPTGEVPDRGDLTEDEWEIYELVVRRFFATVAEAATWEHLRVVVEASGCRLKATGKRLLEAGYHDVYPYSSASESFLPDLAEGDELDVTDVRLEAKQTQPPRRYGQSRLIKEMEKNGLGTKCLTADSEVLVRDERGDVKRFPVSSLFEEGQVAVADGDTDVAVSDHSRTTLSLNESSERVTERRQALASERQLDPDETVYRIETERGSFSVTDDHPLYVWHDDEIEVVPASEVDETTDLVTTGRPNSGSDVPTDDVLLSWEELAAGCDKDSKLYGVDCNDRLAECHRKTGETQQAFAERFGSHRPAITRYENDDKDVPVWLLGDLGIRPDRLHGLNYDTEISNPFPLHWSPRVARVLGSLLGDGSISVDREGNVVDVRYHNTDLALIEQFVSDINVLFDSDPTVMERPGRESHHKQQYQVNLSSATGRILLKVLERVREDGLSDMPETVRPAFVGSLLDDEGHVSRDGKAFISNTDHDLLEELRAILADWGIDAEVAPDQHKLHVRGRRDLERFFDIVPVTVDEKFYRGLDTLSEYQVTRRKAKLLESIRTEAKTTSELTAESNVTRGRVQSTIRELRADGRVEKSVEGSNRGDGNGRTVRYIATDFEDSVYATLRGQPSRLGIRSVEARDYDGPVYDLTIDEGSPNFAVQGGAIVHNSTRHNTIEKLYDRGYIEQDPPRPTALAEAVVEAAEEFAERVVSDEMTAQLEADMTAIAEGEATLKEVTDESREMLERVFEELRASREAVGEHLQESLKADRRLGPCPESDHELIVRRSGQGSYFVGCEGFPDCRYTLPLPSTGEPLVLDETCEEHGLDHVKMLAGRDTFVHGCPQCAADEADENEDEVIGACPECGESVAPAEQRDGGGEAAEADGGELAIKHLRSGSRLVGCTRYPDCDYSLPLPRRGEITVTDDYCEEHGLPALVVDADSDDPWELGCPICNYREYRARNAVQDLEDLNGVGSATAEKLADAGIDSPDDLRGADPERVAAEVQGVSASQVRDWQEQLPEVESDSDDDPDGGGTPESPDEEPTLDDATTGGIEAGGDD
ncbi:MAG: DNA topoisomerase [Haloarculaceae archaeon]